MGRTAKIRTYEPKDRQAVRELACDTADLGEPIDNIFGDREAAGDVLARYYTDFEPESLWVAEYDGRIVGYLTGCLDTQRCERVLRGIVARAAAAAIRRGVLLHGRTWHLLAALLATGALRSLSQGVDLDLYPAHFHVNVSTAFRGHGFGQRLVESFRQQIGCAGIRGIHVITRGDNPGGRRFFEKLGFHLLYERPLILPQRRWFVRTSTAAYGWRKGR